MATDNVTVLLNGSDIAHNNANDENELQQASETDRATALDRTIDAIGMGAHCLSRASLALP